MHQLKLLRATRQMVLKTIDGLSTEQLNKIPAGFSNNIAWNFAHLIAAQQGLCYLRAGLPMHAKPEFFEQYKPGTKPEHALDEASLAELKIRYLTDIDLMDADLQTDLFSGGNFKPYLTRFGTEANTIGDALDFTVMHEGIHLGYIFALKRAIA